MINALIDRLEKARGPDRGLDGLIARDVLGWLPYFDLDGDRLLDWPDYGGHWHLPGDPCDGRHSVSAPRNPQPPSFTASIDAALTLVPPHHLWELKQGIECRAIVWMLETDYDDHPVPTGYSTIYPALALCIAALKARQAEASS